MTSKYCQKSIIVEENVFPSIKAASDYYKVSDKAAYSRLKYGWSTEEAFVLKRRLPQKISRRALIKSGHIYLISNRIDNKKYVGITSKTIEERYSEHLNLARLNHNGVLYSAIRELGEAQFSCSLLETSSLDKLQYLETCYIQNLNTIYPSGYNKNLGGNIAGLNLGIEVVYKGETYPSLKYLCRELNQNYSKISARIRRGIPIETALSSTAIFKNGPENKIVVDGIEYRSIREASKIIGIDHNTVFRRLYAGYDVDTAFSKEKFNSHTFRKNDN